MSNPIVTQRIVADHQQRLTANAARGRLIALATCCRPSRIGAAARALRVRLTARRRPAPCCA